MKNLLKITTVITLLLIMMLTVTAPAFAAGGANDLKLSFALTKATLAPGEETTVTVALANYDAGMTGLRAIGVEIGWDSDALEIVPSSAATLLTTSTAMLLTTSYNAASGMVVFTYLSTGAGTALEKGKTDLFSFSVRAKSAADGMTALNVALKVADAGANHVVPVTNAPAITITAGAKPTETPDTPGTPGTPVTPETPAPFVNPFTDVRESDWFYTDVMKAHQSGLVAGTTATTFSPDRNLTYAEAIKLAACMHQLYTAGTVTLANGSPWYRPYADYAKANGIIGGDCDWNAPATRAGYMEIFAKALPDEALAAINSVPDGSIPDVPASHPNAAAIYKLYRAGIVQGVDGLHNCNPDSNIKRGEVAAILTRMMDSVARVKFGM